MACFDPKRTERDEQNRFESCGRRVADDRQRAEQGRPRRRPDEGGRGALRGLARAERRVADREHAFLARGRFVRGGILDEPGCGLVAGAFHRVNYLPGDGNESLTMCV